MYNDGDHEINHQRRNTLIFSLSYRKITLFEKKYDIKLRLLTHVGFFSKTWSDNFRCVSIYGKEQEFRKKNL